MVGVSVNSVLGPGGGVRASLPWTKIDRHIFPSSSLVCLFFFSFPPPSLLRKEQVWLGVCVRVCGRHFSNPK